MTTLRWIWQELTRPRSLRRPRKAGAPLRRERGRRSGVALLVAITTLAVLAVVVSELSYVAQVRFLTAYHQRDKAQSYWLARSGVNIYVLILAANRELGKIDMIADMGLGDSLWQMVPVMNTGLMRMLLTSGGDVDDIEETQLEEFAQTGRVSDAVAEASREESSGVFSDRDFLDFDGDFSAEVTDEEGRIDVNQFGEESADTTLQDSPTAQLLFAMMSGEENDEWFTDRNLDRWEIIGNLRDWIDADNIRSSGQGGYEDNLYNRQDPPYAAKNAKLDTMEEIRLVEGWQDDVFERFGDKLTIWSQGKFNTASLEAEGHAMLIRAGDPDVTEAELTQCLGETSTPVGATEDDGPSDDEITMEDFLWWPGYAAKSKDDYAKTVASSCPGIELDTALLPELTSTSRVFRVVSVGLVANSSVTVTTILDYSKKSSGELRYWRVE